MEHRPEFTKEQEDWICYVIGDWYLDWKHRIVLEGGTHRLGIAKEHLKKMLCEKTKFIDWKERLLNDLRRMMKKRNLELTEQQKNVVMKILELEENK